MGKLWILSTADDLTEGHYVELQLGANLTPTFGSGCSISLNAASGGTPAWGSITGTLSNQTDINNALGGKADTHSHPYSSDSHGHANDHAPGSDNQDLSGKVDKVTGSSLVTDTEISKLAGVEVGANNYSHPANHAASVITQDVSNRFVSDTEKSTWNGKEAGNANIQSHVTAAHAPSTAQANADITKAEIEAKLTGALTSHSHAAASATWKNGIATKNITDASTTQNIAHGLGRVPTHVKITGAVIIAAALTSECIGVYDGTNHSGLAIAWGEGTSTATTEAIYTSTAAELGFAPTVATNPFTGTNRQTGVITCDATNIIITWTKAGTVASLTASLLWEVN